MMNDFVHCNKCFALPEPKGPKFWLSTCTHIFCDSCSVEVKKHACSICNKRCSIMAIDSNIKPEVRSYFEPVNRLLMKVVKVEQFQQSQRERLRRYYSSEAAKGRVNQEKWEKRVTELKREIHSLRNKHKNDLFMTQQSGHPSINYSHQIVSGPSSKDPSHYGSISSRDPITTTSKRHDFPRELSTPSVNYGSTSQFQPPDSNIYSSSRRQMTSYPLSKGSSNYCSTFNQHLSLAPVTPMVKNKITPRHESPPSRGSSKLTLRSAASGSLSAYRTR